MIADKETRGIMSKHDMYQQGLTTRSIRGLSFTADQKAVRYDQLGQYFDLDLSPAIDEPDSRANEGQSR